MCRRNRCGTGGAALLRGGGPEVGGVTVGARVFSHPQCLHVPEIYDGIAAAEAEAILRAFFATVASRGTRGFPRALADHCRRGGWVLVSGSGSADLRSSTCRPGRNRA